MSSSHATLSPAAAGFSPARALTILVADDSRIDRRIAAAILEGRGHKVLVAADGTEALATFRQNEASDAPFDAAVIDFQMPGLGGEDLALALRAEVKHGRSVPLTIVLLSGITEERPASAWKGIDAALPKPLDPAALVAALERNGAPDPVAPAAAPPPPAPATPVSSSIAEENLGLDRVVFDLGEALKRARGKRALLVELVKIFMEDSESYMVTLRQAVTEGNLEQVERAAHRLKGSSANVSAQRAADAAEKIEKTLRATQTLPEGALFETLAEEMGKARRALTGFLAQNGTA